MFPHCQGNSPAEKEFLEMLVVAQKGWDVASERERSVPSAEEVYGRVGFVWLE